MANPKHQFQWLSKLAWLMMAAGPAACAPQAQTEDTLAGDFDAYVQQALDDWGIPGVVIVVVRDGETIYSKGHGSRVLGEDRPIDDHTVVQIASHSKPVTATALAMLVEEGELSWDDPVRRYIPEFSLPDVSAAENVTIRDLLSHQAGLPGTPGGFNNPDFGFPELVEALATRPMATGFRERFNYSNAGYAVAGEVLARVSGESWEEFIKQRVFAPLGMASSYTSTPDMLTDLGDPTPGLNIFLPVERSADSIFLGTWESASCGSLYAPAGGILTTAEDIAKWMTFLIQDGEFEGVRLLSEQAIWETRSPQVPYAPEFLRLHNPLVTTADYGLGWVSFEYEGRTIYEHPGGWMASVVSLIPEEGLAVGVFCNGNFESGFGSIGLASALKMEVFERLLGAPDLDWNQVFLTHED